MSVMLPLMYRATRDLGLIDLQTDTLDGRITFTRPSQRAGHYTRSNPALLSYASNDEWLAEYDPATGICLGRSVWAAATNLLTYSEQFDNAAWNAANRISVTANAAVAPDGTTTADKLAEDSTAASTHLLLRTASVAVTTATVYTISIFAKAAGRNWFNLQNGTGVTAGAYFNLSNGTIGTVAGTGSPSARITDCGDGWYRCEVTFTTSGTSANMRIYLAEADNDVTFDGDGTSGIYIWGAQFEAGSIATPYIQTTSATVTRSADSAVIFDLSSIGFNASEGAMIVSGVASAKPVGGSGSEIIAEFNDGTANERILLFRNGSTQVARMTVADGGANQAAFTISGLTIDPKSEVCFAATWAANDFAASANGGVVSSDASGSLPTVDRLSIGGAGFSTTSQWNGHIKRILTLPRRPTNAELALASRL